MGIFDELNDIADDLAADVDNPDAIKSGTYPALISGVKVGPTKSGDKIGTTLFFLIDGDRMDDDDPKYKFKGRKLQTWQQLPTRDVVLASREGDTKAERVIYYFQRWMDSLGFTPEDRKNLSEELFESLEDREVIIDVKAPEGDGFPQVTKVVMDSGTDDSDDLGGIDL